MTSEDDFDFIVAYAAHRLVQDLRAVAAAVYEEYVTERLASLRAE